MAPSDEINSDRNVWQLALTRSDLPTVSRSSPGPLTVSPGPPSIPPILSLSLPPLPLCPTEGRLASQGPEHDRMATLLKGMMGNKWKWQWSGSGLSMLLLLQLTNASGGRWIHPWVDPSKGLLLSRPVCLSLYLPLVLPPSDPPSPPFSLTHFSPGTFLTSFLSAKLSHPLLSLSVSLCSST